MDFKSMVDKAAAATNQAMNAAGATTTKLSEVGAEKVKELVAAFQLAVPHIRSAGYDLTEFEIELGVTPKLIPHFRYVPSDAAAVAASQEALKDNKLGVMLLTALLKAGEVHGQIKMVGYAFSHVEIELGLVPAVRLQYKNEPEQKLLLAPEAIPAIPPPSAS